MKIIAFDQSTTAVGFAVMNDETLELIASGSKRFDTKEYKDMEIYKRLYYIKEYIISIIKDNQPEVFAIENVQLQTNVKTYGTLSGLKFMILDEFIKNDYLFYIIESSKWKSFCEIKGKKREAQKQYATEKFSKKYNKEITEDEADAIGICECVCSESLKIEKV